MKAVLAAALALLLAACSTVSLAPPPARDGAEAAWARVLERFVNERGEVDFAALAKDRADLDLFVRHVAATSLTTGTSDERLAHMINAYNALSMANVIDSGIPASHDGNIAKLRFFVARRFDIGGHKLSLYAFENGVIRPLAKELNEPRIHFALNCSARSCPRLPREPFRPGTLGAQLERETRAFFARADSWCVDGAQRVVWLSELLSFYPDDFVPRAAPSLLAYAARHAPGAAPVPDDWGMRFSPYDWRIANSAVAQGPEPTCPPRR
jgi:Protein of unknown function, DUF547